MHDVLRQRLIRKIESLPDEQIYQVLDYIEFLESKYVAAGGVSSSGLQKFAEGLEDKLRRRAVSPSTIREAFQLISAADRVLSGVSSAGRQILDDLGQVLEVDEGGSDPAVEPRGAEGHDTGRRIEADPRKRRAAGPGPGTDGSAATSPSSSDGSGAADSGGGTTGAGKPPSGGRDEEGPTD
ncbi:MAG: DUF2281 domain-containing protein [Gemmatimonadota bacterium]|nr:DUF2281 domain-containing protein [Gemmatimonadota bacterium]